MRRAAGALAVTLALLAAGGSAQDRPGDFDFYVLALSWSPTWCADEGRGSGSPQCRADADLGFVVHGLWPQNENGWPEHCYAGRPPRIPGDIATAMADLMPDRDLVFHQWRKHGTCSGLSPEDYFATTRDAFARIALPSSLATPGRLSRMSAFDVENAFAAVNPGLVADGIAVSCADGRLEEVRICLTRELAFRSCEAVDRHGCRRRSLDVSGD
jgi:ribonuclease T2